MSKFESQFEFDSERALFVGVEREFFITNREGIIVPKAQCVLDKAGFGVLHCFGPDHECWEPDERFGYELSACQIESRTEPSEITGIKKELLNVQKDLKRYLGQARGGRNLRLSCIEVAPETMPLDVYPDPSGRYQKIVKKMPREILLAACRIIGTHVHVGMPDHESALRVYNAVIKDTDRLCKLGDKSNGWRLEIYKTVAPDCLPRRYIDWQDFYAKAVERGFVSDPRKCWTLIRISKHGTIEFRMFGATEDIDEIVSWVEDCHSICKNALLG